MTQAILAIPTGAIDARPNLLHRALGNPRMLIGGSFVLIVVLACVLTLPATLSADSEFYYNRQRSTHVRTPPEATLVGLFGYDALGRSILARCLLGGALSILIGCSAAAIAVVLGVTVGLVAGYRGGWVDAVLMRAVDILYGLPYILLVVLFKVGLEPNVVNGSWFPVLVLLAAFAAVGGITFWLDGRREAAVDRRLARIRSTLALIAAVVLGWPLLRGFVARLMPGFEVKPDTAGIVILFVAIGMVGWLTMARVVRGQVLSLREMPFIEAGRAMGLPPHRIFLRHVLPNLVGPITVYATLTVPAAILQESFLSFLGVGVRLPLPTWGNLASEGVAALTPVKFYWWMLTFPCLLLMTTLLSLNFLGDGLRDLIDAKNDAAEL
jgi:ABC-type dipeptide/oligopeptide/nickel transport system permease subunit